MNFDNFKKHWIFEKFQKTKDSKELENDLIAFASDEYFLKFIEEDGPLDASKIKKLIDVSASFLTNSKISRRKFIKGSIAAGILAVGGISASGGLMYNYLVKKAAELPRNYDNALAILITEPTYLIEKIGTRFDEAYVARIELAFGFRAKYVVRNATKHDFKKILYDKTVQNISILGHGDNQGWFASGEKITKEELYQWYSSNKENKTGWLLKHTCGVVVFNEENPMLKMKFLEGIRQMVREINNKIQEVMPKSQIGVELAPLHLKFHVEAFEAQVAVHKYVLSHEEFNMTRELLEKRNFESLPNDIKSEIENLRNYIRNLYNNNDNLVFDIFGTPFFQIDKICKWNGITWINNFMLDPFAGKKPEFDKSPIILKDLQKMFGSSPV